MVVFPNAKINLGLHILNKRADGFHNLESILVPIGWQDVLEMVPSNEFAFQQTGLTIDGATEDNLVVRAYKRLQASYDLPPVHIHLHKVIPFGAGLGGGSADGAFAIRLLNELFELGISIPEMESIAGELGSDCPFFIQNIPALVSGRGTEITPLAHELRPIHCVVEVPPCRISTKEAYAGVVPKDRGASILDNYQLPPEKWHLVNDFESGMTGYPEITELKEKFYRQGAVYASLSGSGSSVFGLFREPVDDSPSDHCWSGQVFI